jgi:hypothetical protein
MQVNKSLVMQIRRALYSLKRDYGAPIEIYKLADSQTDVRTGSKSVTKSMFPIRRGIVLPEKLDRVAQQSISLISSNKQFVSGGTYDVGTREFIIDRRDCPLLQTLSADDWIVYNLGKYQIKNIQSFEANAGWIVTAKHLKGEVPERIVHVKVHDLLTFESVASATVE